MAATIAKSQEKSWSEKPSRVKQPQFKPLILAIDAEELTIRWRAGSRYGEITVLLR
ncbi:MAG: hypothetical protein ACR2RV_26475 [Verrucomicrobiales bacterium]